MLERGRYPLGARVVALEGHMPECARCRVVYLDGETHACSMSRGAVAWVRALLVVAGIAFGFQMLKAIGAPWQLRALVGAGVAFVILLVLARRHP